MRRDNDSPLQRQKLHCTGSDGEPDQKQAGANWKGQLWNIWRPRRSLLRRIYGLLPKGMEQRPSFENHVHLRFIYKSGKLAKIPAFQSVCQRASIGGRIPHAGLLVQTETAYHARSNVWNEEVRQQVLYDGYPFAGAGTAQGTGKLSNRKSRMGRKGTKTHPADPGKERTKISDWTGRAELCRTYGWGNGHKPAYLY